MKIVIFLALWVAATVATGFPAQGAPPKKANPTEDGRNWKVFARAHWPYALPEPHTPAGLPQQLVIRTPQELVEAMGLNEKGKQAHQQATTTLADILKVDVIDWSTQMLVVVTGGVQWRTGYSVEINFLEERGRTLTVFWKLNRPKPGAAVGHGLTHPAQVVLVERFDGFVTFHPSAYRTK
ncbi:MAG: protease complex subunit PrcB family protein [Gemmataceae bacterium]|nr:protease complex subunit PrcB family protein [Gemmataceae bacterium]